MFTFSLHTPNDVIHSTKASMWAAREMNRNKAAIIAVRIFVISYSRGSHHDSVDTHLRNHVTE